jgi:hypothetical protein
MTKQEYIPNKRSCVYKKSTNTLDCCHKSKIEVFETDKQTIFKLKDSIHEMKVNLEIIKSIPNCTKTDMDFWNIVFFKDEIMRKQLRIDQIETNENEINYYTDTSDILYNYYDLVENNNDKKMNISSKFDKGGSVVGRKSILSYFLDNSIECKTESVTTKPNDGFRPNNRASLLDEYLSITDIHYINDNINNDIANRCHHCYSLDRTLLSNDSISYCNNCYAVDHILTDNEKPSYKDPPKEISYFSYKRINHYQEWLNQIQGKETTDIPEIVFDQIMLELKKQRIFITKDLTSKKIKEILKKLKINKYYEHIPYIMNRITGIPNPNLSSDLEEKLRNMFKEIQVPFLKHAPLARKNFLSYSYVIHKFLQILEKPEYIKCFPLLKSREKLHQQEEIWKNICKDLNWVFVRSI